MLTRLRLLNYRSHGDTSATLKPLTVFVGKAGTGKSNLFKALVLLQNSVNRELIGLFPPGVYDFNSQRSRWADEHAPLGIEVDIADPPGLTRTDARYMVKFAEAPAPIGLFVSEEILSRQEQGQNSEWVFRRHYKERMVRGFGAIDANAPTLLRLIRSRVLSPPPADSQTIDAVTQAISKIAYFHLEVNELRKPGGNGESNKLGYSGENLPGFIEWTRSDPEGRGTYEKILSEMQQVLPHLHSIVTSQVGDKTGLVFAFRDFRGGLIAPETSDGTLLTLGLLAVIHAPSRPNVLCIEEPETGLHPGRLRWLFDRLLELAYPRSGPAVQVLLSTHSPYVLDFFHDMTDAVNIVDQVDGRTRITSLQDSLAKHHIESPSATIGHEWAMGLFEGA